MTALFPDAEADLRQENARLLAELRTSQDRLAASADILRAIASTPGDAEASLQQIAETTARLFGAASVSLYIADGEQWVRTIRVGARSNHVSSQVSPDEIRIGGRNLPGTVVHENRQIHIPDLDAIDPAMADWAGLRYAHAAGTRTMCGTPLRRGGRAFGVLIVHRDRLAAFTPEELALQQSFADKAVIAIENARLFNETQEALARQTATSEILRVISRSPTDVQPVFDVIVLTATRLFRRDIAFILGCDATSYWPVATAAPEGLLTTPHLASVAIDADANFPSRVIITGKNLHLPDWAAVELPEYERMVHETVGINSALYLPLLREGKCVGVLGIAGKRAGFFGESEIALAESFRDQAVIAIENARLFNETREALERQTATADILKVIARSPTDVQPVFEAIATSAKRLLGGFSTTVFRFIDGALHLMAFTPTGAAADQALKASFPSPVADFPLLEVVHGGKAAQIADTEASSDPRLTAIARSRGFRSMLFTPLMSNGAPIGMIGVARREPGSFAPHDVQFLQTFADQAVIAIENVRLFDEVQAKTRDLGESLQQQIATADVLKVISRSVFDLQTVLDTLVESAYKLCGASVGLLYLRGDEAFECKAIAGIGVAEASLLFKGRPIRAGRGTAAERVIMTGEVQSVTDFLGDPDFDPRVREVIENAAVSDSSIGRIRSTLAVPMTRNDAVIGVIAIARPQTGAFPPRQIELLQTFADQAVIAIENVRLFDEVQAKTGDLSEALQQQTATADVLKVISRSAFDLESVMNALTSSAAELCGAQLSALFLCEGDLLMMKGHSQINQEMAEFLRQTPVRIDDSSHMGRAVLTGAVANVPDFESDTSTKLRIFQATLGFKSILVVPLMREGGGIGVFALARNQIGAYSQRQVELVQTFADQAVIAIENVRLFDEVQARTRDLAASLDDLRTAQDRLIQTEKLASLGQLTAGIAHEIKNPLNFVNNFSALSAELTDELNELLKSAALGDEIREEVDELTQLLKDNLQKVVQHGKRADSIVKNMLLHSREGSGEHRPTDINALLDESLNLAYHGARAEKPDFNVTLQRQFDADAGMIELFPQEISRVFLNLISNGFYATAKRKAETAVADFDPVLSATTRNLGNDVEIRIRDNGTGIPDEVREKMFNPFFTTKPAGEGTGLGLSMSHDIIVKQHGGTIDVETQPGQFTEFRIVLPRTGNSASKNRGQT
jgi:two-component system, NtrC family, sensor kinase